MSDSFATLWTTRLLCPCDFSGKNTGMGEGWGNGSAQAMPASTMRSLKLTLRAGTFIVLCTCGDFQGGVHSFLPQNNGQGGVIMISILYMKKESAQPVNRRGFEPGEPHSASPLGMREPLGLNAGREGDPSQSVRVQPTVAASGEEWKRPAGGWLGEIGGGHGSGGPWTCHFPPRCWVSGSSSWSPQARSSHSLVTQPW